MRSFFDFDQNLYLVEVIIGCKDLEIDKISYEAIYRNVIHDTYYACYNRAKEWLELNYNHKIRVYDYNINKMRNSKKKSAHVIVYEDLAKVVRIEDIDKIRLFKILSENLEKLFELRKISDYEVIPNISYDDARVAILHSYELYDVLDLNGDLNDK